MKKRSGNKKKLIRQKDENSKKIQWNLNEIQSQPKVKLGIMLTVLVIILTVGFITLNGQSSTASLGRTSHIIPATTFDVYRTTEGKWVRSSQTKLQALDVAIIRGKIYFFEDGIQKGKRTATAIFLGHGSKTSLQRLNDAFDPNKDERPSSESQIVYAKWKDNNFPTYLKIGYLKPNQTFYFQGREFRRKTMPDGGRAVELTGNVISIITAIHAQHHDNQVHLTLHYPKTGQISKIVTTHNHPFYVPSKKQWVNAALLTVGIGLYTCDSTKVEVAKIEIIDKPFVAHNLTVANSHNYYVTDAENPIAPAVLVHNAGKNCVYDTIPDGAQPVEIKTPGGGQSVQGHRLTNEDGSSFLIVKGADGKFYKQYSGGLIKKENDIDLEADSLAEKLGGESRVTFARDPAGREFDVVSDAYIGQAKPGGFNGSGTKHRAQMRETFEAAAASGRSVYYNFNGAPPSAAVRRTLERYKTRYKVDLIIKTDPL